MAAEGGVQVQDGWIRLLIATRPAAGYFTLHNTGNTAKTLIGAASPGCGALMLHESLEQGGQDRMVMLGKVDVPAHGVLRFAPGGYHLMCVNPTPALRRGSSIAVTLRFADGGTLEVPFAVRGATAK
jgi:copper(I)-binding protein